MTLAPDKRCHCQNSYCCHSIPLLQLSFLRSCSLNITALQFFMHLRKVPRDLRIYYFWLIPEANSNPWGAWRPPEGTWIINRPRRAVVYIQFEREIIRSFNCAFLLKTCSSEGHLIAAFSLKTNVTNRLHTDQGRATWERIYIYAPGGDSKTFSIPNHFSLHRS